jgi:hypothetical protein
MTARPAAGASLGRIAPTGAAVSYFSASRAPRYSITFALPLLLAYEALAALLSDPGTGLRNGADVLLKRAFMAAAGPRGPAIFLAGVILLGVWLVARDLRRSGGGLNVRVFAAMMAESALLAVAFGAVVGTLTAHLLGSLALGEGTGDAALMAAGVGQVAEEGWWTRLMLSLGAGLYEELFFRVLLVTALAAGARAVFGAGKWSAGIVATVVGAVIFSAFHYIPPLGDPFELQSFVFRTIGGLAFSALYLTRGFGITAWTHALYDAFLLLL